MGQRDDDMLQLQPRGLLRGVRGRVRVERLRRRHPRLRDQILRAQRHVPSALEQRGDHEPEPELRHERIGGGRGLRQRLVHDADAVDHRGAQQGRRLGYSSVLSQRNVEGRGPRQRHAGEQHVERYDFQRDVQRHRAAVQVQQDLIRAVPRSVLQPEPNVHQPDVRAHRGTVQRDHEHHVLPDDRDLLRPAQKPVRHRRLGTQRHVLRRGHEPTGLRAVRGETRAV